MYVNGLKVLISNDITVIAQLSLVIVRCHPYVLVNLKVSYRNKRLIQVQLLTKRRVQGDKQAPVITGEHRLALRKEYTRFINNTSTVSTVAVAKLN